MLKNVKKTLKNLFPCIPLITNTESSKLQYNKFHKGIDATDVYTTKRYHSNHKCEGKKKENSRRITETFKEKRREISE